MVNLNTLDVDPVTAVTKSVNNAVLINQTSNSPEWYTPSSIIEAARSCMGSIDLDPASCEEANERVKAKYYFTKEDDGLNRPWNLTRWFREEGECHCHCHTENAKNAELKSCYHLNFLGVTMEHLRERVSNVSQNVWGYVLNAENTSSIALGGDVLNVFWHGTETETIQLLNQDIQRFAQVASMRNQQHLSNFLEREHVQTVLIHGAEIVAEKERSEMQPEADRHPKEKEYMPTVKLATDYPPKVPLTNADEALLTMPKNDSSGVDLKTHYLSGHSAIGKSSKTIGTTNALIVDNRENLHKIILFLYTIQNAQEQYGETYFHPVNIAMRLKDAEAHLFGSKKNLSWIVSCNISKTCSHCQNCMCIQEPANSWINHPFSAKNNPLWIKKIIEEYQKGNLYQSCNIVFASTSEKWFQPLFEYPICFIRKRVNYHPPAGKPAIGATKGSCVIYLGPNLLNFYKAFRHLGQVMVPLGKHFDPLKGGTECAER